MWLLWQARATKRPPANDPLAILSADEVSYILKVCGAGFRPPEFGDANALRLYP